MSTKFEEYLADEVKRYQGVAVPAHASLLRRALVRRLPCKKIHPNPQDEFCDPKIGPNGSVISGYVRYLRDVYPNASAAYFEEPLMVEKIRPDGYMLLNGHHRWAAALQMNRSSVPVSVVNLTQENDIHMMLKNATHDRRVTLDLDEVVFLKEGEGPAEKPLPFPIRNIYKEPLRLGIPALFHYLKTNGYDIWVYSANYYSVEYIRRYFMWRHVLIDGIVTGSARKDQRFATVRNKLQALIEKTYPVTVNIDRESVTRINAADRAFERVALKETDRSWSQTVMDAMGAMIKHEG